MIRTGDRALSVIRYGVLVSAGFYRAAVAPKTLRFLIDRERVKNER